MGEGKQDSQEIDNVMHVQTLWYNTRHKMEN